MSNKVRIFTQVLKYEYPPTPPSVMLQWYARELGKIGVYESPLPVPNSFTVALSPTPIALLTQRIYLLLEYCRYDN